MKFALGIKAQAMGFLTGVGVGSLLGLVAGLAVGFSGPGLGLTTTRLALSRGLITAGACVVTGVVGAGILGSLFA